MTSSVALVGNPNTGKSTLFNTLTGLSQRVGNYPGVTVERKSGTLRLPDGSAAELVDLPGVYSLSADAPDERICAEVLLEGRRHEVDAVIAILDAGNLRRNLYLVSQLLEGELPVVVALNMWDVAESRGVRIEAAELERRLGAPVVPMVAHRGRGIDELLRRLAEVLGADRPQPQAPPLPPELSGPVERLLAGAAGEGQEAPTRQRALRALVDEGGPTEQGLIEIHGDRFRRLLSDLRNGAGVSAPLSAIESEARYAWVGEVLEGCVQEDTPLARRSSDRIDRILTHRVFGLALFLLLSAVLFQGIYAWATPGMDLVEGAFSALGAVLTEALPPGPFRSMLVDGVVAGVGGVLIFLPQIALLFLLIGVLEDCGYMARAALLMDRLLGRLGLSGRSFIPLLSSFACAVPGVMSARTIADRRDRFVTVLVAPLMSCSARLPVYALFIAAFIPERAVLGGWLGLQGLTLLAMYSVGAIVAVPVALLLRKTLLRGESSPFLLELPAYSWPTPRTVLLRVYHSGRAFVVRAGSVILAATIVMWALAYYPRSSEIASRYDIERAAAAALPEETRGARLHGIDQEEAAAYLRTSFLGRAGQGLEPVFEPLGWDWRIGMAAIASFPAREVIISALGTIYSLGSGVDETSSDLRDGLRRSTLPDGSPAFNVPVALSVMVFFALCAQCMSTLAVIQRETSSWAWPVFAFVYMTCLAYVGAFGTYRLGLWMGW